MIRFLQQDNKLVKIMFGVIIGAACVSMVIYLVPGLMDPSGGADAATVYATVHTPGFLGRIFGETTTVKMDEVNRLAERQLQQQMQQRQIPDSMMRQLLPLMVDRIGPALVQRAIEQQEADRLHLQVSDDDLRTFLRTGPYAQYLFPNGQYVGDDGYINFIQMAVGQDVSKTEFEAELKQDLEVQRLQALITDGVTVSDAAVRDAYRVQGTKVKFDYAVISADDIKKTINPSDAELQAFFKSNAGRYATAIPDMRKIQYVAFDAAQLPGGKAKVSDAEIQAYYAAHQADYKTEEMVQTRHILINAPAGTDAKTDAAAKAKAQDVLKQVQAGGNFADLAKKYSDDKQSAVSGGEIPLMATAGLDPAYAKAAMALNPGQTSGLVKSAFGYHIIQLEKKVAAGEKPLADVKDSIAQTLEQQKQGAAEQQFGAQLAAEAKKNGLDKTAAAHGLHVVTTDYIARDGVIGGLSDSAPLLTQAFVADKGAAPQEVSTGDGYAVFQVVDIKPAHAPDFAQYKSHILDDYREEKVPALVEQETNKLDDRAKVLNDLKKAAAEMKIPFKSSDFVGQDGQVPDVGAMSGGASVAFSLPKGAISPPINTGQAGVVLVVTDKQQPSADEIAQNFDRMKEQLVGEQKEEVYRVFLGTLSQKYESGNGIRLTQQPGLPGRAPSGN